MNMRRLALFAFCALVVIAFVPLARASVRIAKPKTTTLDTDANLVGWWTMDNNQISGSTIIGLNGAPNLTETGTFIQGIGKIGQSIFMNCSSCYASTTNAVLTAMPLSFSAWVRFHDTTFNNSDDRMIIAISHPSTLDEFWMSAFTTVGVTYLRIVAEKSAGGSAAVDCRASFTPDTNWHLFTASISDTTSNMRTYIDGVQKTCTVVGTTGISAPANLNTTSIGAFFYNSTTFYKTNLDADVDDVRVYSRALSANEVHQLYTQGSRKQSVAKATNAANLSTSLVGWWPMSGTTCGAAYCADASGTGNTATTSGATVVAGKIGQGLGFNLANAPATQNGLTGWWNMDLNRTVNNIADASASNNPGYLVGATTTVTGEIGQAISLAGPAGANPNTNYIGNFASALSSAGSARTVCAWIYPKSTATRMGIIGGRKGSAPDGGWALALNMNASADLDYYHTGQSAITVNSIMTANAWQHVCVTYDGSANVVLYRNGAQVGTQGSYTADTSNAFNGVIGDESGALNSAFYGYIDDVRVYNRVLSASEITGIYNAPVNLTVSPSPLSSSLDTFSSGISIGAWVKYASSTGTQIIMRKADTATSSNAYELLSNGTNFQLLIGTTTSLTITGTTTLVPNKWYYVAGTADGSTLRLYVNGLQEASATQSGSTISTNSGSANNYGHSLFFGSDDTPSNFLIGTLSDARVYSRALSSNEVYRLYTQGMRRQAVAHPKPVASNLSNGLKGWWTMDGMDTNQTSGIYTLQDKSGNHNTATSSATVMTVAGKIGQAVQISSSGSGYLNVNDSSSLQLSTSLTTALWFKKSGCSAAQQGLIRKDSLSGTRYLWGILCTTADKLSAEYYNGTDFLVTSLQAVGNNAWHHAAEVIDGTTETLYVDGVAQGTATITGTQGVPNGQLDIGADPPFVGGGARAEFFDGAIDDVRIYSRALSGNEVYQLYRLGL